MNSIKFLLTITVIIMTLLLCSCQEYIDENSKICYTSSYFYSDNLSEVVFIVEGELFSFDKDTLTVEKIFDNVISVSEYKGNLIFLSRKLKQIVYLDEKVLFDFECFNLDSYMVNKFFLKSFRIGSLNEMEQLFLISLSGNNMTIDLESGEQTTDESFDVPIFSLNDDVCAWIRINDENGYVSHELEYKNKIYPLFTLAGGISSVNENNYLLNPNAGIFACDAGNEVFLLRLDDETKIPLPEKCDLVALYSDCIIYKMNADVGTVINIADFDGNVLNEFTFDDTLLIIPDTYEKKLYAVDLDSMTADTIDLLIK